MPIFIISSIPSQQQRTTNRVLSPDIFLNANKSRNGSNASMFTNSMNLTVPGAGPGGGAGGLPPSASLLDGGGGGGGSVSQLSGYVGGRATPNGDAVSAGEGGRGGAGRE